MSDDLKFKVGAEDTGVEATMARIEKSVSGSVESIKASFEGLTGVFKKVQGAFLAFELVLKGGEMFKEAVEATVNMAKESQLLGRQLGISATDASILKIALAESFVTQEQWSAGAAKITQALNKNEGAFKALGVATRDQNGDLRNAQDIQLEVNEKLMEFAEGTARNAEAVKIYGRSWREIEPTFRVNNEAIKEAAVNARELGLVVGQESVAQSNAYRKAMVGVHDTMEGISVVIGNALLPILTQMGQWFREVGPAVIGAFKTALGVLGTVFEALKEGVIEWKDQIVGAFNIVMAQVSRITGVLKAVKDGANWDGVKAAWQQGTEGVTAATKKMADNLKQDIDESQDAFTKWISILQGNQTEIKKPSGGKGSGPADADLADLKAGLEAEKAAWDESNRQKGQFIEFSKQQEVEYWQNILATKKLAQKDAGKVQEDINKLLYAIDKRGYEDEISGLKSQESKYKNNLEAKLQIAQEMAAKIAAAEGGSSPGANRAQGEVLAIEREIAAQKLDLAKINQDAMDKVALAGIDAQEAAAKQRVASFQETDQQLLAQQRTFEAQRLAVIVGGINAQIAAANANPEENVKLLEQLNAQKIAAATKYQAQMSALNVKAAVDQSKEWSKAFTTMTSGFQTVISGMLQGTMTFSGAVKSLYKTITSVVADTITQMMTTWLRGEVMKLIASKTSAVSQVATNAAVAASGAFAATAMIPYIGPELAPGAAAAAYGETMAFQGAVSARGGYDIPAGVNPVVQTHQNEMILPEKYANTIRDMADGGGGGGGGGGGDHIHLHLIDTAGAKAFINKNRAALAGAVHNHLRATGRLAPGH